MRGLKPADTRAGIFVARIRAFRRLPCGRSKSPDHCNALQSSIRTLAASFSATTVPRRLPIVRIDGMSGGDRIESIPGSVQAATVAGYPGRKARLARNPASS